MCSPRLLATTGQVTHVADLARLPLLVLEERYKARIGWAGWLANFGVTLPRDASLFRFNDYSIVLQAAMEGQGVAQGWRHIVEPLIAQGLLVRPIAESVTTDQPMYIVAPGGRALKEDVQNLKDWLVGEAQAL